MQRHRLQLEGTEPPLLRELLFPLLSARDRGKENSILPKRTHLWVSGRSVMPGTVRKGMQRASAFSSGGCWGQVTHPHFSAPQVTQTFRITLRPVDDALPQVQNFGMRVQEGVRKTITEFELKAADADTEVGVLPWPLVQ